MTDSTDKGTDPRQQKKLTELAQDFNVAMLATQTPEAGLRARPMVVAEVTDHGDMSFVTTVPSGLVDEVAREPNVCVALQGRASYASISGIGRIRRDPERVKELWNPAFDAFFPQGPSTPAVAVVEVQAKTGEYWDQRGLKGLELLFEAGRAVFEGRRPDPERLGEHGAVDLQ